MPRCDRQSHGRIAQDPISLAEFPVRAGSETLSAVTAGIAGLFELREPLASEHITVVYISGIHRSTT
jgi:hypothetical protein